MDCTYENNSRSPVAVSNNLRVLLPVFSNNYCSIRGRNVKRVFIDVSGVKWEEMGRVLEGKIMA